MGDKWVEKSFYRMSLRFECGGIGGKVKIECCTNLGRFISIFWEKRLKFVFDKYPNRTKKPEK